MLQNLHIIAGMLFGYTYTSYDLQANIIPAIFDAIEIREQTGKSFFKSLEQLYNKSIFEIIFFGFLKRAFVILAVCFAIEKLFHR